MRTGDADLSHHTSRWWLKPQIGQTPLRACVGNEEKEHGEEEEMAGQSPGSTHLERLREGREGTLKGQKSCEIQSGHRRGECQRATIITRWGREFQLDPLTEWFLGYGCHSGIQRPQATESFLEHSDSRLYCLY